jgi:hypothetical protein
MNNTGKPRLTKLEQNGLIGAIGDHHVFPKPHQLMNELISPDSFRF